MIIAISGGSGFIGKKLVHRHLLRGDNIRVLTRKPGLIHFGDGVKVFGGDLVDGSDTSLVSFVDGADVLYHCAGELKDENYMENVNVRGTKRLLDVGKGRIKRWVQLSSVGAYGPIRDAIVNEGFPENPKGVYEKTKTIADNMVREAALDAGFEFVLLRPSIVYGKDMPNKSLYQMINRVNKGHFFFIGPKGASANYISVDDVVMALELCGTKPEAAGKVFNVSNWCTLEDMINSIAEALNKPLPLIRLPLKSVRFTSKVLGKIPNFPLTLSRVDALTNRATYPADRIQGELGLDFCNSIPEGMFQLTRSWLTRN